MRYVVKGIKNEQIVSSVVNIYTNSAGKIEKVEDKWDGNLPDSSITNASAAQLASLWWWVHYAEAWVFRGLELDVGDARVTGALNLI